MGQVVLEVSGALPVPEEIFREAKDGRVRRPRRTAAAVALRRVAPAAAAAAAAAVITEARPVQQLRLLRREGLDDQQVRLAELARSLVLQPYLLLLLLPR